MKQKLLSFLLALLPIVASADAVEIDGIYYNLINKGRIAEVTGGKNDEIVLIPETVIYNEIPYQVTKIGAFAFAGKEKLKSINIPKSIVTISEGAFNGCI